MSELGSLRALTVTKEHRLDPSMYLTHAIFQAEAVPLRAPPIPAGKSPPGVDGETATLKVSVRDHDLLHTLLQFHLDPVVALQKAIAEQRRERCMLPFRNKSHNSRWMINGDVTSNALRRNVTVTGWFTDLSLEIFDPYNAGNIPISSKIFSSLLPTDLNFPAVGQTQLAFILRAIHAKKAVAALLGIQLVDNARETDTTHVCGRVRRLFIPPRGWGI